MLAVIGWLACLIPLAHLTGVAFFITVPTFGGALFTGKWYEKLLGVCIWIFTGFCWVQWLSVITVNV